jgi:hypothetical protein
MIPQPEALMQAMQIRARIPAGRNELVAASARGLADHAKDQLFADACPLKVSSTNASSKYPTGFSMKVFL